ncbi:DUF4178 domain-containing protein [Paenibacillus sp. P26]|nr:DUF4178 domain-containing protein [Paenibacillus sp. P26]UUZ97876.1 DUF4178 domain-containing protein [Paenibacillus sp. P25]
MSIWKRAKAIIKSNQRPAEPPKPVNSLEETRVGDIINVDLEEYVVSGKLVYFDRGFPRTASLIIYKTVNIFHVSLWKKDVRMKPLSVNSSKARLTIRTMFQRRWMSAAK